jgi:pimeloyl-ACP methyl ester carboxylesterase
MADFLLIHGACHGAWCWRDVIPALQALGHTARAIDLPSHGDDKTPVQEVTLGDYRDAVLAASSPDTHIVGHSMGGYPIGAAAQAAPDAMASLIYLCAYPPAPGQTLADRRRLAARQLLLPAVRRAPDGLTMTIDPAMAPELFYHDCPPGTPDYAVPRLCPQALAPQETVVDLDEAYESVPKSYIVCADDRTIAPEHQRRMVADWPRHRVHEIQTSHSPFFADPTGLAALLGQIAQDR